MGLSVFGKGHEGASFPRAQTSTNQRLPEEGRRPVALTDARKQRVCPTADSPPFCPFLSESTAHQLLPDAAKSTLSFLRPDAPQSP